MSRPHTAVDIELTLTGDYGELNRIPPPPYRHAAPSGPWPWIDTRDEVDPEQLVTEAPPVPKDCDHTGCNGLCWRGYPQSRFPNWTPRQVEKCKINNAIKNYDKTKRCVIYKLDVDKGGIFHDAGKMDMVDDDETLWELLKNDNQDSDVRVRALFIEDMSGPVLKMLGGKYNIEPFFFSSSLNWIPTYFQEDLRDGVGDHITITLPFIQAVPGREVPLMLGSHRSTSSLDPLGRDKLASQMIDTQAPLRLKSSDGSETVDKALILDLLSVHLVRNNTAGNTLISFHASMGRPTTKAFYLHERIRFAGQSVYWQKMLEKTDDPTFLLLIFVWHAMYAWDEALQQLYEHICTLETDVIKTSSMYLTEQLHMIRAHLLHYSSLLTAFENIVTFIMMTPNPALLDIQRSKSKHYLERECNTLLEEIERLKKEREMQEKRLENVMDLVFSSVNILDSKTMQKMTEATVRDSAAMKQIAYLTMVFFPASFVANVFGMNVNEIVPHTNPTLAHYFITTCCLTATTVWIIVAFQSRYLFHKEMPFWQRLGWPIYLIYNTIQKLKNPEKFKKDHQEAEASPMFDFGVLRQGSNLQ